jgi:ABC-type transport system involved in multi-copper enzyme maturation permease subunit
MGQQLQGEHISFARYIWIDLYDASLLASWMGLTVILALGGLRHEHSNGASAFSLSLPARRRTWIVAQTIVAMAESIFLGFLPAVMIPALSPIVGQGFPQDQAAGFAILMVGTGLVFSAWTLFISQLAGGELASLVISLCSIGAFFVLVKRVPILDRFDIFDTMTGADMLDRQTFLLHGPLPWETLAVTTTLLLCLIWLSMIVIERRDF